MLIIYALSLIFCANGSFISNSLYCMTCISIPGDTTQLDQFRVRHRLLNPNCKLEPVECLPYQDVCVTITMQVAPQQFWIGSGCDQRINYDSPTGNEGCIETSSFTRNFIPGYMEKRRVTQEICLCTKKFCNTSFHSLRQPTIFKYFLYFYVFLISTRMHDIVTV